MEGKNERKEKKERNPIFHCVMAFGHVHVKMLK
jgi:hypothetical protein